MQMDNVGLGIGFIVVTPVEFSPKTIMIDGINLYSYVLSNSITNRDPYGLFSFQDCGFCGDEKLEEMKKSIQNWCDTRLNEIQDSELRECIKKQCDETVIICSEGKPKRNNFAIPGRSGCTIKNLIPGWCKKIIISPEWWPDIKDRMSYGDVAIHEFAHNCTYRAHDKVGVPGTGGIVF